MFARLCFPPIFTRWSPQLVLCLAVLLMALASPAHAARRALVIGNAEYKDETGKVSEKNKLPSSVRDADAVAHALRTVGFNSALVTVVKNATRTSMSSELERFLKSVEPGDEVIFYFSGHGISTDSGGNFLVPVDGEDLDLDAADFTLFQKYFSVSQMLDALQKRKPGVVVAILDACRSYPTRQFNRKDGVNSTTGLNTQATVPQGQLLMYAAANGQAARSFLDGNDRHELSVYTRVLVEELVRPADNVSSMAHKVTTRVAQLTERLGPKNRQYPEYTSKLYGDFTFVKAEAPRPVVVADTQSQNKVKELEAELERLRKERSEPTPTGLTDWDKHMGMVELPRGSYLRGSADEDGPHDDKGPVKEVRINHRLLMGRTEVTRGQFAAFVNATKYRTQAERDGGCYALTGGTWGRKEDRNWQSPGFEQTDEHPVVCVSWNDAQAYIEWLNKQAGYGAKDPARFRLPSESEWEYAARGVTHPSQNRSGAQHWRYPWGDDKGYKQMCNNSNGADQTSKKALNVSPVSECEDNYVYTAPVGRFTPNAFNLYDMIGNAGEWAQDCYASNYDAAPTDGRAHEPSTDCSRVLRGGSWDDIPFFLRAAFRLQNPANFRNIYFGLRLARTVSP